MIYIQPYYYWEGHYKIYTRSLFKKKGDYLIKVDRSQKIYGDKIFTQTPFLKNYNKNFLFFIFSRILNFLQCLLILLKNKKKFDKHDIHFLEFEPVSLFFFLIINFFLKKKVIFTIHSTSIFNKNYTLAFFIQRILFYSVLLFINFFDAKIIVHKKEDLIRIKKVFKKKIYIFDYPSKKISFIKKKFLSNCSLLVIGQIRKDKDIETLLEDSIKEGFKVTIAGKIYYNKSYWYNLKKTKKLKLIDKYIDDESIKNLIKINDFIFLPYGKNYSGSAGPLKDSLSYGQPVLCSNLIQFQKIIKKHSVGYIYSKKNILKIRNLKSSNYNQIRKNCMKYVKRNNFDNFYHKITKVY